MLLVVGWMALLLSAPVYPFGGGAALLTAALVVFLGDKLNLLQSPIFFIAIIAAPLVGFYFGYKIERRLSIFGLYRLIRDIIRMATGVGLIIVMLNQTGRDALPPAQMLGVIVFFPIALWIIKRIDRLLKLDKPQYDPDSPKYAPKEAPEWLQTLMEKTNFGVAFSVGVMAGLLGFVFGREAGILFGLLVFVLVMGGIMIVSGGFAALVAINSGLRGFPLRLIIGAALGAAAGNWGGRGANQSTTEPELIILGTVLGVIGAVIWSLIANRKKKASG